MPGKINASLNEILDKIEWGEYRLQDIFDHIQQGRRLKKDDQIPGAIPFVMSGTTNTGVVGFVSNPVVTFPANSITVDIFGNAFYRDFSFGAGDDTGVYWNEAFAYSKNTMLFIAGAIQQALKGKFSYGNKLRSSQSFNLIIQLPKKGQNMDFNFMDSFITRLNTQQTSKLEEYLLASKLKNTKLSPQERRILDDYKQIQ